jgi:hypothetical protein
MKYPLRFVWYVLRLVIIVAAAFAVLVVAFFIAMDSANVYVIVSDGMKANATAVLMPDQGADLTEYFSEGYLKQHPTQDTSQYANFVITGFDYRLSVESLWCNPWNNTATVTVVESIPTITSSSIEGTTDESGKAATEPPQWPRSRYKIKCIRENGAWRIDSIELVESLKPEPTSSPEPSNYITASPVPTKTPAPTVSAAASQSASASPTPSPAK